MEVVKRIMIGEGKLRFSQQGSKPRPRKSGTHFYNQDRTVKKSSIVRPNRSVLSKIKP